MKAAAQWVKIWVFSMEIPGSNTGKFVSNIFHAPFYPVVTVQLQYFYPMIYNCLVFAL